MWDMRSIRRHKSISVDVTCQVPSRSGNTDESSFDHKTKDHRSNLLQSLIASREVGLPSPLIDRNEINTLLSAIDGTILKLKMISRLLVLNLRATMRSRKPKGRRFSKFSIFIVVWSLRFSSSPLRYNQD